MEENLRRSGWTKEKKESWYEDNSTVESERAEKWDHWNSEHEVNVKWGINHCLKDIQIPYLQIISIIIEYNWVLCSVKFVNKQSQSNVSDLLFYCLTALFQEATEFSIEYRFLLVPSSVGSIHWETVLLQIFKLVIAQCFIYNNSAYLFEIVFGYAKLEIILLE